MPISTKLKQATLIVNFLWISTREPVGLARHPEDLLVSALRPSG